MSVFHFRFIVLGSFYYFCQLYIDKRFNLRYIFVIPSCRLLGVRHSVSCLLLLHLERCKKFNQIFFWVSQVNYSHSPIRHVYGLIDKLNSFS